MPFVPHSHGGGRVPTGVNDDGRKFLQELPAQRRKDYACVPVGWDLGPLAVLGAAMTIGAAITTRRDIP